MVAKTFLGPQAVGSPMALRLRALNHFASHLKTALVKNKIPDLPFYLHSIHFERPPELPPSFPQGGRVLSCTIVAMSSSASFALASSATGYDVLTWSVRELSNTLPR